MKLTISEGCNIYAENTEVRPGEWSTVRISHPNGQVHVILTKDEMERHANECQKVLENMRKAEDDAVNARIAAMDKPKDPEGDFVRGELKSNFANP